MGGRIGYLVIFFIIFASPVFGATKYVSPSGSATWANCNSTSSPCAVSTALSNAVAGDIVLFMDGTYNVPTAANYETPAYNPSNSGTSESPITFKALNRHQAVLKGQGGTSGSGIYLQPMIGAFQRSYIVWDGFYVYARNNGDTATIFGNCRFDGSTGSKIINSRFVGGTHSYGGAANSAAVFVQGAPYTVIENNEISAYRESSDNPNNAGIITYPSNYVTIKNNTFYDNTTAIHLKDQPSYCVVTYNDIRNNYRGIHVSNSNGGTLYNPTIAYNVIANNPGAGIQVDPDAQTRDLLIYNNILYYNASSSTGNGDMEIKPLTTTAYHPKIYNNIIYRRSKSFQMDGSANNLAECDHNQYSTNLSITMHKYQTTANYTSLVAWQNSGELYGGGNPGVGSLNSDPLFVNSSGTFANLADFALQGGSPCLGAGRNGENMGVDVSLVGVDASGEPPPPTPAVTLSGTAISGGVAESEIRAGGQTIIMTVENDTFTADACSGNNAVTTAVLQGCDSAQSESDGWDARIRPAMNYTHCARTSDEVLTITLPAVSQYSIDTNETVTCTLPASAMTGGGAVVASPTMPIIEDGSPILPVLNFNILGAGATSIGGGTGSMTIQ